MVCQMLKKLNEYEKDSRVKLVILKGNGKAFSAGGDCVALVKYITAGHWSFGASFYRKQLILDYIIATHDKTLVSLIDGVVMGGGAGLSMNANFRVVTEKAVFAMPESSLGLFPDVGASYFLSRLPGFFGEYLGLTGARLGGAEMVACGLATHFILSKDLPSLEKELDGINSRDPTVVFKVINNFIEEPSIKSTSAFRSMDIINKCFSRKTVEEILSALENEAKNGADSWIVAAIKSMKAASPTSLKIFLRSIRKGRGQGLDQCLIREFRMASHALRKTVNNDFYEGCRAILFDKDKQPKWEVPKLELVTNEMVGQFFTKVDDDDWEDLRLDARSDDANLFLSRL
ncbi:3-hydroxyisobutyryl-CoA hydrolase 1-like isoform X1 [Telopea speciosissima]|uniref:3-hydroxyisobutyryl-CoA hydrolase 1-like isoform X1 n=1 Tax=Telopea speciosissima TaxID=54955 RepID=UPI001CC4A352|nr:3-hydroxyisobutyryl-CoA hydrolase 1-like isoform X1 [Telopea speciosissima]